MYILIRFPFLRRGNIIRPSELTDGATQVRI